MKCPRCNHIQIIKNGKHNTGKQRYFCKVCKYNFTLHKPIGKSKEMKIKAFEMYMEGLGFSSIGRVLKVSDVSVLRWIRKIANNLRTILQTKVRELKLKFAKMELDEMWHYVKKNQKKLGFGSQLIQQILP